MVYTEPIFCRHVHFWFQISISQLEKLYSNCTYNPLMHIFLLSIDVHYHRQHWSCCQYDNTEFDIMDFLSVVFIAAYRVSFLILSSALLSPLPHLPFPHHTYWNFGDLSIHNLKWKQNKNPIDNDVLVSA